MRTLKFSTLISSSLALVALLNSLQAQKVHTTYLWHMDQPVYWADKSKDKPDTKQFVEESHRLKTTGGNTYPGSTKAHPTNDLHEIFSKADRVQAYQTSPRNAISSIRHIPNAGAQLSISAGLLENIQSLGLKNQWGYSANWMNAYKEAIGWKTSGNFPRLDVVNFSYDHSFSPFISERTLIKQIKAYQYVANKYYGYSSKGYWPAEGAFTTRIIKALRECGIEWSVIANSHLARTLADYVHPFNINGNIDPPNRADRVPTLGVNWFDGAIDGRGNRLAAPYCYQAHKAQHIDPSTGIAYTIDVIPMCNYMSYIDGYSGANVIDIESKVEPFSNTTKPSIVLLAHDGDNAWGGGSTYYHEAVPSFTNAAFQKGYEPTTIQQFLNDHPVPHTDIVKVEDGAWVNADSDWGHPQFINWLWPLYSKPDYRFNPDGWTEDARNWAVITATENFVTMAEDLEGGNLRTQFIADGGAAGTDAEKAWHFYFGGLNSGFMYYGKAEDMEVKPSMTGNIAIDYARRVIQSKPGIDHTAPSVFIPQRYPYNPGGITFGPTTGYKKIQVSSDFHVWTFAYDVSGIANVVLKYRTDNDGENPIASIQNELYANGSEVENWQEIAMTRRPLTADPTTDPELIFFIKPEAKADLCYAEIKGLKDKLVDYYVEATDTKGNVFRTPIQHVYIESGDGGNDGGASQEISWEPRNPTSANTITITATHATAASMLHWGVNGNNGIWSTPIAIYQPVGTTSTSGVAVETPFTLVDGKWQVVLGPFNKTSQAVNTLNFVIKHANNQWDNNGGSDYTINLSAIATDNPTSQNISKELHFNQAYTFSLSDFAFASPKGNTFKAIRLISLPESGSLAYNASTASLHQLIHNPALLVFTAGTQPASFQFKIVDNADLESDGIYTVNFNVLDPNAAGITVSFKRPTDWGNSNVHIWAWTSTGNLFSTWPGPAMTDMGNGLFSYTFNPTIASVHVIFSKNANPQTIDIMNINASSCYQQAGMSGNKLNVSTYNCNLTNVSNPESLLKMNIYPQPARDRFIIELPNLGGSFQLKIKDINGKTVMTDAFTEPKKLINISNLHAGIYLVSVHSTASGKLLTGKLSIHK